MQRDDVVAAFDNPASTAVHLYRRLFKKRYGLSTFKSTGGNELSKLFEYTELHDTDIDKYVEELARSTQLSFARERLSLVGAGPVPPRCVALYVLIRCYHPSIVIETGVRHGESSVYILEALRMNGQGKLYSIDVPTPQLPKNRGPGWIIPDCLRQNWELVIGKSQDELEPLLCSLEPLDFFYHDSFHKYPLMKFEFDTVIRYMNSGIISSHDINRNHAFLELCSDVNGTVNIQRAFKIGNKGVFGFTYVGDLQNTGIRQIEDG